MMKTILPMSAVPFNNVFLVNVTPEIARDWLVYNQINRPVKPQIVEEYIRQIESGQWKRTHQGLAFTHEGALLDGQHRLLAVIRTGRTLPMLVTINEPAENYEFVDCGRTRSNLDMLRIGQRDTTLDSDHLETLRSFLAGRSCKTRGQWTSSELNKLFQKHCDAICFAVDLFQDCKNKNINDPTVRGVIARAQYHVPKEWLAAFANQLINGSRSDFINELRKNLIDWTNRREHTKREIYQRCEQTLNMFLLKWNHWNFDNNRDECFPIPNEVR
jgi:hypothetical protein